MRMGPLQLKGRWVLVTGASSGIGLEIARELARTHGANLVLVARRLERLQALADELPVEVCCIQADLAEPGAVERVVSQATAGRTLHAVVLNAGIAFLGSALRQTDADVDAMVALNVTSTVHLTRRLLRHLVLEKTNGALLIVSSLAGSTPTPWLATYSGTKAFLTHYGLAVGQEVRPHGVSVTVFAPGGVLTEMGGKSGTARKFKRGDAVMMEADVCARDAVQALVSRRAFRVPGLLNNVSALLSRWAPRGLSLSISNRVYQGALLPEDHEVA